MTNEERTDRWIKDDDADIPSHFFTKAELARREQAQAAQHTPGPWRFHYISIGGQDQWNVSNLQLQIASVFTSEQDAALIARAPDLLAENARLRSLLAGILRDLPVKRDWLDPDIERAAKEAIR